MPYSHGSWGGLRLLVRMERQGDHQFDALYRRLSARFEQWAAGHPALARATGIDPVPIGAPVTIVAPGLTATGNDKETAGNGTGGSSAGPAQPTPAGLSPDLGIHPLNYTAENVFTQFEDCNCTTADGFLAGTAAGAGVGMITREMDSDADLITGAYLQSHQVATYQDDGSVHGIDLEYSSNEADPHPVVNGALTINTNTGSGAFTTSSISMDVNGVSQGSSYSITGVLVNGTYLVQMPVHSWGSGTTQIATSALTLNMNLTAGGHATNSFTVPVLIDNQSLSPYGTGWTIGGLQQITIGTSGQKQERGHNE
jgi:hypothetical protein